MGSRVAGELVGAGHEVRWLATGRSAQTEERANREGLVPAASPYELLRGVGLVVSVCPPQVAVEVVSMLAHAGFSGTYVDANPVSPVLLGDVADSGGWPSA